MKETDIKDLETSKGELLPENMDKPLGKMAEEAKNLDVPLEKGLGEAETPKGQDMLQEEQLQELYTKLEGENNTLKRFEKEREKLDVVKRDLGMEEGEGDVKDDKTSAKIEEIKARIAESEKEFLGFPEGQEEGEGSTVEEYVNSAEFLKLKRELDESINEAREKYVKETTDKIAKKYEADFKRAVNGENAMKLFKAKFPIHFRENLEASEEEITHVLLQFKTVVDKEKGSLLYVKYIEMANEKPEDYIDKANIKKGREKAVLDDSERTTVWKENIVGLKKEGEDEKIPELKVKDWEDVPKGESLINNGE